MNDIAIIGYSGVFPEANSVDKFAENLYKGVNAVKPISENRLKDTSISNETSFLNAGYLEEITRFDYRFFDVSLGEAREMTPHQRLTLQEAYKTFEHAGYRPKDLKSSNTAVYVADTDTNYYLLADKPSSTLITGNTKSIIASRISRFFDLRGIALNVDTTCSSSLTAVSIACKDITLKETDMALVCGVCIDVIPKTTNSKIKMGVESEQGVCSPFSKNADGTMSGETVACILLKDLESAQKDNDIIHGVIKGVSLNQDGALSSSITAPSSEAQAKVIDKALQNAKVRIEDISFIEAHGTGTKLGDPIEIDGLYRVLNSSPDKKNEVYLSSVKSNIGHTDGAAGLVGIIKVLLSFKNKLLYPSINATPPNPLINFEKAGVNVLTKPRKWNVTTEKTKRIAGVSSFGLMGTNAHLVLEAYEYNNALTKEPTGQKEEYLCCFSAKSRKSLYAYLKSFAVFLETSKLPIDIISRALNTQKQLYEHRYVIRSKSTTDLITSLKALENESLSTSQEPLERKKMLLFDHQVFLEQKQFVAVAKRFRVPEKWQDENLTPEKRAILLQYFAYKTMKDCGITTSEMFGIGTGKFLIDALESGWDIDKILEEVTAEIQIGTTTNLTQRVEKLIKAYGNALYIINVGFEGVLATIFKEKSQLGLCFYDTFGLTEGTHLAPCLNTLFQIKGVIDPKPLYMGPTQNKVSLPAYVFDGVRCWLRTKENVFVPNGIYSGSVAEKENSSEKELVKEELPLLEQLQYFWYDILKTEVGPEDDFFDMGGHSLNGSQLLNRINAHYKTDFDMDVLFDNGTPNEMSEYVKKALDKGGYHDNNSIPMVEEAADYPVSFAQKRLWLLSKLSSNTSSLNIGTSVVIDGAINQQFLIDAFHMVMERHEALRTKCIFLNGVLRQKVYNLKELKFEVKIEQKYGMPLEQLKTYALSLEETLFDLDHDALIRVNLIQFEEKKHALVITLHHLISDGWSVQILFKEVFQLYNALVKGEEPTLAELRVQYKDYTAWMLQKTKEKVFKEGELYWLDKFSTKSPELLLQYQKERPPYKTYNGAVEKFIIPDTLAHKIKEISVKENVTHTMLLGALLNIFLYKLSGNTDITLGMPISERDHTELEGQIGLYLNMLSYRMSFTPDDSLQDILRISMNTLREAYKHKLYPFELLVEKLKLKKDHSRLPLFDIALSVQNYPDFKLQESNNETTSVHISPLSTKNHRDSQFDLNYRFTHYEDAMYYELEYNKDLFSKETIADYHHFFIEIITQCVENIDASINSFSVTNDFLPRGKKEISPLSMEDTAATTIVKGLENIFKKYPRNIALSYQDDNVTYKELDERSSKLAYFILKNEEVIVGDRVVLSVDMSPLCIIAIIGILKSGLVYVPVDSNLPAKRQAYITEDVDAKLIIDNAWLANFMEQEENLPAEIPFKEIHPNQLAYIIYTSGSTGRPNGVMIPHKNVMKLIECCYQNHFSFNSEDVWTLYHNYSFDFSIWEIFGPLFSGGKLILLPRSKVTDFRDYLEVIKKNMVTVLNFTPKVFREFETIRTENGIRCESVKYLIFGGDALYPKTVEHWLKNHKKCGVINMYGITEVTVHATFKELVLDDIKKSPLISNIGKPLKGFQFYLLNEAKDQVEVDEIGEIYIAGAQLSLGYFGNRALTSERFVHLEKFNGILLYKSGDMAKLLPNGDYQYVGRKDQQVKINGFRIELNEIKNTLEEQEKVLQAYVIAEDSKDDISLVAYFQGTEQLDVAILRKQLSEFLPYYMVPNFIVQVPYFTLNANGKIAKESLPDLKNIKKEKKIQPPVLLRPKESTLRTVQDIFCEVLNYDFIDIEDDFYDLGGNSLQLVQLHSALNETWPNALLISDLFELNNITDIANFLEEQKTAVAVSDTTADTEFLEL